MGAQQSTATATTSTAAAAAAATSHGAAPFGVLLGFAPGNVPAYSSNYWTLSPGYWWKHGMSMYVGLRKDTMPVLKRFHAPGWNNCVVDEALFEDKRSSVADSTERDENATSESQSQQPADVEKVYTGVRFQCVEYARRWLISVHAITFGSVRMAYDIIELAHFQPAVSKCPSPNDAADNVKTYVYRNGGTLWVTAPERPEEFLDNADESFSLPTLLPPVGALLIWKAQGHFARTGHVAVVTEATPTYCRVAEQNVEDTNWHGRNYARELPAKLLLGGDRAPKTGFTALCYTITDPKPNAEVLGWIAPECFVYS